MDTLPKVLRLCWPIVKPTWHEGDGYITFPNKTVPMEDYSELWIAGLDDKDRVEKILGKEAVTIYFNECSQIPYASVLVVMTRLAQKVAGLRQRAYYDLNPVLTGHWSHRMFIELRDPDSRERKSLVDPQNYAHAFMNPEDNAANLDPEYLQSLRNMPTRQRIRFYEGKYSTEMEGQLWTYDLIEQHRKDELAPEELEALGVYRVVVAVDPSGAAGEFDTKADEIGIVVVARNAKRGFILEDASGLYSPEQWGKIACRLYHKWNADRVVGEKNFGGDMVRAVIQGADPNVAFKPVTASRGKAVRAEPVAAYYERGLISHCGAFPVLEDELLNFTTLGYMGTGSPNHADALVWGLSELFERGDGGGLADYLSQMDEGLKSGAVAMVNGIPQSKVEAKTAVAKIATSTMIKPVVDDGTPRCPSCGSVAIVRIGKGIRCNQCGVQSNAQGDVPLAVGSRRSEYLNK